MSFVIFGVTFVTFDKTLLEEIIAKKLHFLFWY